MEKIDELSLSVGTAPETRCFKTSTRRCLGLLAFAIFTLGCAAQESQCGVGSLVEDSDAILCTYAPIVVVNGFRCPDVAPNRLNLPDGAVVCASRRFESAALLPANVCAQLSSTVCGAQLPTLCEAETAAYFSRCRASDPGRTDVLCREGGYAALCRGPRRDFAYAAIACLRDVPACESAADDASGECLRAAAERYVRPGDQEIALKICQLTNPQGQCDAASQDPTVYAGTVYFTDEDLNAALPCVRAAATTTAVSECVRNVEPYQTWSASGCL